MYTETSSRLSDVLPALRPVRRVVTVRGILFAGFALLMKWQERAEQRYSLADMDERQLRDVGLTRLDLHAEINKPFWQG